MNSLDTQAPEAAFKAAPFIKEIGRGKKGARNLSREDARALYAAMLDGRVSDLELGGILVAMRIKGESVDELSGFMDAAEATLEHLPQPPAPYAPVLIPSYNGSRKLPNLTPLLACLLAREGVPVLVHGMLSDPGRVTTAQIMEEMGLPPARTHAEAAAAFAAGQPAFIQIDVLAPRMARLLEIRRVLGLRNSTHTLVKILQPFAGPALRLTSYTHPEYLELLSGYFLRLDPARGDAFLMRGTEGETVANPKRANQIEWFHAGVRETLVERQPPQDGVPELPAADGVGTALWIRAALAGAAPIPPAILEQAGQCQRIARSLADESRST
jgi:anthranilate phosphoribosyltransferase